MAKPKRDPSNFDPAQEFVDLNARIAELEARLKQSGEAFTVQAEEIATLKVQLEVTSRLAQRRKLPVERESTTIHFIIHTASGDEDGYLLIGFHGSRNDGDVGEFFIKMAKQGSIVSGFADQWAISCSLLLQTGTPLEDLCRRFIGTRFEPSGRSNLPQCRLALSVVDLVAKTLYWKYVRKCLPDDTTGG